MIAIASFTQNGRALSQKLQDALPEESFSVYQNDHKAWIAQNWQSANLIIYIGATGIAVRSIAPHIKDKMTDPAVLVLDEHGKNCISLLSGHMGGGNEWTLKISTLLGATPIITTATDLNCVFAVDIFAKKNHLTIGDRLLAKKVSAQVLNGEMIPIFSEIPIAGTMPKNLCPAKGHEDFGIYVGISKNSPFKETLHLIPKILCVGMGCKKGTSKEKIQALFDSATTPWLSPAIHSISSVDLKSKEAGFLDLCQEKNLEFITYSAQTLLNVAGHFSASPFVEKVVGVSNVCERSAVKTSGHTDLLLKKTSRDGVTIAISKKNWSLNYA